MDAKNTLRQHLIVGIFSVGLAFIFRFLLDISWSVSFARVSFFLLFLVLAIGPIMRMKKFVKKLLPNFIPLSWRGELGIWFFITSLAHFVFVLLRSPLSELIKIGGSGYGLTNLIGLIALVWALFLAATSFGKVIVFLGVDLWKKLHSLTYVVFYLVAVHFIYFQFFSTYGVIGPDWFGYFAVVMTVIVIIIQIIAFILTVTKYRKEMGASTQKSSNPVKKKLK
jgi:sulfoxide reductase heme-binding subunit YedZ